MAIAQPAVLASRRLGLDRAATARRNRDAFAAGDAAHRDAVAKELRGLADDIAAGAASPAIVLLARNLIWRARGNP